MECVFDQVDPQYASSQGFRYRLSLLLCQDGFSFLVTHAITQKILRMASYKLSPTDIQPGEAAGWPVKGHEYFDQLKTAGAIHSAYQRIDLAIASCKISVAPDVFFDPGTVLNIMTAAHTINEDEEILTDSIINPGPSTAVLIPRYVQENCGMLFPEVKLQSAAAVLVKGVMQKYSQLMARQVFINIYPEYFEMTVIQGMRLLYLNAFRYSAPSDVLYYVIFVLEQLGFVPSEANVILQGDISETSSIFSQLKMYCASISFAEKPAGLQYGDAFARIVMHNHSTLLNLALCE